ncbi:MAG: hypothetical protein CL841_00905 [Crocinitomicaceae bacterium]|nr:hypothetical protein [Crocinitomicaceae bacterium]
MKNLYFILIIATIISSCKKNRNSVSWNTFYKLPISSDTLNLKSFINEDKLYLNEDGTYLSFKDTFELYKIGIDIIDQSIQLDFVDSIKIPSILSGIQFSPGFQIPFQFTESHFFDFNSIKLKELHFESLIFNYTVESSIDGKIDLNLSILDAFNPIGNNFNALISTPISQGVSTGKLNLDGFKFDLTKGSTAFNHISTQFTIGISSENLQDLVFQNTDYILIKFEISSLKIASALGYLGSENIVDTTEIKIPFMENLNSKNFEINDSEFELLIKNGIGIDAQLKLNKIEFKKENQFQALDHLSVNQNININRALDLEHDFQYSVTEINFNNSNSNLPQIMSIFPEKVNIDYQLLTNPLGNQSGYNDFIYQQHPLSLDLSVDIPLNQNLDSIVFLDTLNYELPKNIIISDVLIKLDFNNGFPWKCCANLNLISGESLNSAPICINHCQVDNLGNFIQATNSKNELDLENDLLIELQNNNRIILELVISSPDSTNYFPILENQNFYYSINMDVNSKINLN